MTCPREFLRHCLIFSSIILWSVSVQEFEWQSDLNGRTQFANNCDYKVEYIGNDKSKKEDCGELCYQKLGCNVFLWTPGRGMGTCTFERGYAKVDENNVGICGRVLAEKVLLNGTNWNEADGGLVRWAFNCDVTGEDIEVRKTPGDQCAAACSSRVDCIAFVWTNYDGGSCRLKSDGYTVVAYTGTWSVCGEIIERSPSFNLSSACDDFTKIASHYRMTRGLSSQRNDFPWMAALFCPEKENGVKEFRCAGTIISDYYILSAAHCLEGEEPTIVRLGTQILTQNVKTDLNVERCIKHPTFSTQTRINDIGLVKVRQRITFNAKILPACLRNKQSDVPWSQVLVLTGWGSTETDHVEPSNFLRKTHLRTVKLQNCQESYLRKGSEDRNHIHDSQYCATDPYGSSDDCAVDSGGILQIASYSPLATVVGIASWSSGCDGIYTRVGFYLDWIEEIVSK